MGEIAANSESTRPTRGRPKKGEGPSLTLERITHTALRMVDQVGLDGLTMRRLASELGVDPMSLYNYLPNKAALYDSLVDALMSDIPIPADLETMTPEDGIRHLAISYRDAILRHPKVLRVLASRPVRTPGGLLYIERVLGFLIRCGFSLHNANAVMQNIASFVLGSLFAWIPHAENDEQHEHDTIPFEQLPASQFPHVLELARDIGEDYHYEEIFLMGVDALIRGFCSR